MNDVAIITSGKKLILYDLRNTSVPRWDSTNFEGKSNVGKSDDLSLQRQLTKVKCFP